MDFCSFHRANWHSPATLTEVFPCFFLSCKANARVYLAKTRQGPHSSQLVNCVVLCIVCVQMCTVLLPPGDNPTAVNKFIISYRNFLNTQTCFSLKFLFAIPKLTQFWVSLLVILSLIILLEQSFVYW